jgi:hypothetical protein
MTTVVRLARGGSAFDRRLLRAARDDRPPPGAEDAALVVLGMHAALGAGNACAARSARHASAAAGKLGALKLLLVIVAACGAGVVAWTMAHRAGAGTGRAPVAAPAAREVASVASPESAPSAIAEAHAAAPAEPGKAPRAAPQRSSSRDASDLALEVALVQRAAQDLGAGDPGGALAALDEARSRCKHPALVQETGLLRARALAMAGRTAEAATLARQLRDADPRGVLANRFAAIADAGAAP